MNRRPTPSSTKGAAWRDRCIGMHRVRLERLTALPGDEGLKGVAA